MEERKNPKLRCNSEYRRLYQPMTAQEYEKLESELKNSKNTTVEIKTWVNIVLFDYEKLEICKKHNIPHVGSRLYVCNSEEALLWLCKKQLEREDLALEMRKYLIGKRYLYEKILGAHTMSARRAASSSKESHKMNEPRYEYCAMKTRERLAKEYNVVHMTIWKYSIFAEALDTIYDISEELATAIMRGNLKISQENVVAISKLSEREILNMAEQFLRKQTDRKSLSDPRKLLSKANTEKSDDTVSAKSPSIKDMPQYDPDSEAASLALTIPSWISSMNRISNAGDMSKFSKGAKNKLRNELDKLGDAISDMYDMLKEEKI